MKTTEKSYGAWYFLLAVIVIYIIVLVFSPRHMLSSLSFSLSIFLKIIPVFILVFVLMIIINYFISPKKIARYLGKQAGTKGWLISIVGGTISTGPIYMWYPLLNDLQKRVVRNAYIATFLYNRAIKLPLLPLIIFYFGLPFTVVLTLVMIIFSIFQGILVEKLMEVKL